MLRRAHQAEGNALGSNIMANGTESDPKGKFLHCPIKAYRKISLGYGNADVKFRFVIAENIDVTEIRFNQSLAIFRTYARTLVSRT